MGKIYTKPDIVFESFSLSTSIAAGCEVKTNTPHSGTCGVQYGAMTVFLTGVGGCGHQLPFEKDYWVDKFGNAFCYHNPSEDSNLFNS